VAAFVGRKRELRQVAAAVDGAAAGRGVVLSISGEPGIGKSRLARECLALARSRGFSALIGAAGRFQTDLSYAPLMQALRPLVEAAGTSRWDKPTAGLDDLSGLFDGLPSTVGIPGLFIPGSLRRCAGLSSGRRCGSRSSC